jgi:hypothetical protein
MKSLAIGAIVMAAMVLHMESGFRERDRKIDDMARSDAAVFGSYEKSWDYWSAVAEKHPELFR